MAAPANSGVQMANRCFYTGKGTTFGKRRAWRGQKIVKGGFGLKPTGISPRKFKANLQKVRALVDNGDGTTSLKRIKVSTKAIRCGMVAKPLRRKYGYTRQQKQAAN